MYTDGGWFLSTKKEINTPWFELTLLTSNLRVEMSPGISVVEKYKIQHKSLIAKIFRN